MKTILIILLFLVSSIVGFSQQTIELKNWKFSTGDNLEWAKPGYNDSAWKPIKVGEPWEFQGYKNYDGYAWYRITFKLPSDLKKGAFSDALMFFLGKVDDSEQTFLNGKQLGENGKTAPMGAASLDDLSKAANTWSLSRNYTVELNDPRLLWDKENVLAVRVYDGGNDGGILSPVTIRSRNLNDILVFDLNGKSLDAKQKGIMSKSFVLKNLSKTFQIKGKLKVEIINGDDKKVVASQTYDVSLNNGEKLFSIDYKSSLTQRMNATYTFTEAKTKGSIFRAQALPFQVTDQKVLSVSGDY